jgi:hypothetical protein
MGGDGFRLSVLSAALGSRIELDKSPRADDWQFFNGESSRGNSYHSRFWHLPRHHKKSH